MEKDSLLGMTVYIISEHDEGEQVRKHKKRRINKKWKKRYGVYHSPLKPGQIAIAWSGILLMTRPTYQKVKKILSQKTDVIIPTPLVGDYFYYQPPKGRSCGRCTLVGMCQYCPENRIWRRP